MYIYMFISTVMQIHTLERISALRPTTQAAKVSSGALVQGLRRTTVDSRTLGHGCTWTSKVPKILAFIPKIEGRYMIVDTLELQVGVLVG